MWKFEDYQKIFDFLKSFEKSDYSENILNYIFNHYKFDSLDDATKEQIIIEHDKIYKDSNLEKSVTTAALSDFSITNKLFETTLDQKSFDVSDWNKLRGFIINWYASLKSMVTVQKSISDLYGMPDKHLDEAFKSKGCLFSTQLSKYGTDVNYNKVNFYYDLVNLYKQKGSPRTLLKALTYFGFPNIELLEYFTYVRKSTQKVEFHSSSSDYTGKWYSTNIDILPYDEVTKWDPHYITSEKSIVYGQNHSNLHLPTKSPYFSLRHFININDYVKLMSFISRKVQDQYKDWAHSLLTNVILPPKDLYIESCTMEASVLELYLACIHTYYKFYGTEITSHHPIDSVYDTTSSLGNHGKDFLCYDGTDASYLTIVDDFEEYIDRHPLTRDEVKENQEYFLDLFSRLASKNFLKNENMAGKILKMINPELFSRVNELYDIKPETIILGDLLEDLMKWTSSYASIALPHLNFVLFGSQEFKRLMSPLLDFFKPYHARLLSYDLAFITDDRNTESAIVDDSLEDHIVEVTHDWDTCNSKPCCNDTCLNSVPDIFYSRDTYDCGSYYDIGGACDGGREGSFITEIEDIIYDPLNCLQGFTVLADYENPSHENYKIDNYTETELVKIPLEFQPPENVGETITTVSAQSGNFMSFDEGGCFDGQYGSDACFIQIIE